LFGGVVRVPGLDDPDRDRFILSKGHAALALYATLFMRGVIDRERLDTYCGDDSWLGVHPEHALAGIDFSTGSLGHGLSMGAGAALAARLDGSPRRVFVLVSDAECNEGSSWEAVAFAAHHRLSGLIAIVDANGQQALGQTRDVLDMSPLAERWRAFGWEATEVDGHDVSALNTALIAARDAADRPHVVIAHTVAGKGVSYMERQVKWHYWPMSDEEYARALREIGDAE
jgi:transketolase